MHALSLRSSPLASLCVLLGVALAPTSRPAAQALPPAPFSSWQLAGFVSSDKPTVEIPGTCTDLVTDAQTQTQVFNWFGGYYVAKSSFDVYFSQSPAGDMAFAYRFKSGWAAIPGLLGGYSVGPIATTGSITSARWRASNGVVGPLMSTPASGSDTCLTSGAPVPPNVCPSTTPNAYFLVHPSETTQFSTVVTVDVGGVPAAIGGLVALTNGPMAASMVAGFTLDPTSEAWSLDNCYDFKWINVLTDLSVNGVPQLASPLSGILPAIDPAFAPAEVYIPPTCKDPAPFYYCSSMWGSGCVATEPANAVHKENLFSGFEDSPVYPPGTVLRFSTFLVCQDVVGGAPSTQLAVLAGVNWVYNATTGRSSICGAASSGVALINAALYNSRIPGYAAYPGFGIEWQAVPTLPIQPCPMFAASATAISVSSGGAQSQTIRSGVCDAGRLYWVLGSASGTAPGQPVLGWVIPLNPDTYWDLTIAAPNHYPLAGSRGFLGPVGNGACQFQLNSGSSTALVGLTVNHAFVVLDLVSATVLANVSNPVSVHIAP